jgi:hypothetical protein
MNCFHNYDRFQRGLKLLRKTIKFCHLNGEPITFEPWIHRTFGFFGKAVDTLNKHPQKRSKAAIFRVACLSQTRATGLAGPGQVRDSINEFIDSVTTESTFDPRVP